MKTTMQVREMQETPNQMLHFTRRLFFILSLVAFGFAPCFSQQNSDTIAIQKTFGGYQFYQDGKALTLSKLSYTLKSNSQAYQELQAAKTSYAAAVVVSCAGGFLVGWPIGTAFGEGEPNWTLAGIGAGMIAISFPINKGFKKRAKQAVDIYNNGQLPDKSPEKKPGKLNVSLNGNGAGLIFRF
ncbi:MAG: hypothetical protein RIC19_00015 [Phaeodactylibacter sp.]|uniref:hypothetical protein n=1 Tax=Phaeodactylibacter sp. TaxID=1940289 RepID=UPI0032EDFD56